MRSVVIASCALAVAGMAGALAQTPLAMPAEVSRPIAFAWSGPVEGATKSLAARLGYTAWAGTATGLPIADPAPVVDVSLNVSAASAAEIVTILNQQCQNRAVIVLDPEKRSIGVVYYA